MKYFLQFVFFFGINSLVSLTQQETIITGIPWYDNSGNTISAHGAGILKDGNKYYMFGEYKSDTSNAFVGFSCYASINLTDWTFEGIVLPVQDSGRLGPQRVGERPKLMKCPSTGEYIMYMHTDNMRYKDPCVGYAMCNTINGEYSFQGPLLFNGKPVKKWDMGIFQDTDGNGYLITHSGNLYLLSDNYKSISRQVVEKMTPHCESPVIFKNDSLYYWIGSELTGWERNDNYYFTATSLSGPWTSRGFIAPEGSLTWNSQSTFVLPVTGTKTTTFIYLGDRWSQPKQHSAATYVWQPLIVDGYSVSMPEYNESWQINTKTGEWIAKPVEGRIIKNTDKTIVYSGKWQNPSMNNELSDYRSDTIGASCALKFKGSQIGFYSIARSDGGYARVQIKDKKGNTIHTAIVDMYCKYPENSLKFLSPKLARSTYILTISVIGEHWYWVSKSGKKSGSLGNFVSLDKILIMD